MSKRIVVMSQWKFMLLLAMGMSIPTGVAIALNAFGAIKRGGEEVLPMVLSDSFWVGVWVFLVGMVVLTMTGMFVKGESENEKTF